MHISELLVLILHILHLDGGPRSIQGKGTETGLSPGAPAA